MSRSDFTIRGAFSDHANAFRNRVMRRPPLAGPLPRFMMGRTISVGPDERARMAVMHLPLRFRVFKWFATTGLGLVVALLALATAVAADAPAGGTETSSVASTSPRRESATISSTAATASSSSTSTTATGSSSASRPPGWTRRASPTTSRGSAPAPTTRQALHQHDQAADVHRPGDREARSGSGRTGRVRPDGDLARRRRSCTCRRSRGPNWNVVDAATGDVIAKVDARVGVAQHGLRARTAPRSYLAGLKSPLLTVADTSDAQGRPDGRAVQQPRSGRSRSTAGRRSCFVNVNELLGLRGRRPEDRQEARTGSRCRASRRGRSSGTAARATASA